MPRTPIRISAPIWSAWWWRRAGTSGVSPLDVRGGNHFRQSGTPATDGALRGARPRRRRCGGYEREPRPVSRDEHERVGVQLEPAGFAQPAEESRFERVGTIAPDRRAHDL